MKAIYADNFVQVKEGPGKGKTFHLYNVVGTTEELADYVNSPQFKKYPIHAADGTPQFKTMYMDPLHDELPLYKKQDGNYTLNGSETRKQLARVGALAEISPAMESQFASRLMDKMFGVTPKSAVAAVINAAVSTGEDANLDEM